MPDVIMCLGQTAGLPLLTTSPSRSAGASRLDTVVVTVRVGSAYELGARGLQASGDVSLRVFRLLYGGAALIAAGSIIIDDIIIIVWSNDLRGLRGLRTCDSNK
jgi:hypothetical protein